MNPRTQECLGLFLYGAGYFSREDNTLGIAISGRSAGTNFCQRCPKRDECEAEHERKVRAESPEAVEQYERLIVEGTRRGAPKQLLKLLIGRDGRDPFAAAAIENFKHGHRDRGGRPLVG